MNSKSCDYCYIIGENEKQSVIGPKTTSYILLEMIEYIKNDLWEPEDIQDYLIQPFDT